MIDETAHTGMVGQQLSEELWLKLEAACSEIKILGPREVLSRAGELITHSALLLDGIMVRYIAGNKIATDKRLVVALQVPGDFVDLHAFPLQRLDHDVRSLTATRLALFPHDALKEIIAGSPDHARSLWRLTMVDAAIHRHWTYRTGLLRALAAVADFVCEMDLRMQMCGRVEEGRVPIGVVQTDLAEVTGLSTMHVSRVIKELRDAKLCTIREGYAEIHDRAGLRRISGYHRGYLYIPSSTSDDLL